MNLKPSRKTEPNPRGRNAGASTGTPGGGDDRSRYITIAWVIGAILLFFLLQVPFGAQTRNLNFTEFLELVDEGRVEEAGILQTAVTGI